MATIRQLSTGKWNAQVRVAGVKSKGKSFSTKSEAEFWALSYEREARKEADERRNHISTWTDMGLLYCERMLMGKSSQKLAIGRVERIGRYERMRKSFKSITVKDVNAYKYHRLKKVSQTTCRDELVMIKRVYRWADKESKAQGLEAIPNPCEHLVIPKANKPRDKVIEKHELERLMAALPKRMVPIVELAYETAMRRSEIVKLKAKHLHLDQRLLSVIDGKEGDRSVPLTSRAVELLRKALDACYCAESRLYPVAPHSITTAVRRARRVAGLSEDIRFHQLRHTRCTIVARKGFNQAQMMVVTGHKDIRSVQRYTHLNAADVVKLLD